MPSSIEMAHLCWDRVTGLSSSKVQAEASPQGALVPNSLHNSDQVAVVYWKGQTPPEITVQEVSGSVQTILANGVAVAVIASAEGPAITADDVLLVERCV